MCILTHGIQKGSHTYYYFLLTERITHLTRWSSRCGLQIRHKYNNSCIIKQKHIDTGPSGRIHKLWFLDYTERLGTFCFVLTNQTKYTHIILKSSWQAYNLNKYRWEKKIKHLSICNDYFLSPKINLQRTCYSLGHGFELQPELGVWYVLCDDLGR